MREKQGKPKRRWKNQRKNLYERTRIAIDDLDRRDREQQRV